MPASLPRSDPAERAADAYADSSPSFAEIQAQLVNLSPAKVPKVNLFENNGVRLGSAMIHTDARANSIAGFYGAKAVSQGHHIAFAQGQFQPDREDGLRLLAHETHHLRDANPAVACGVDEAKAQVDQTGALSQDELAQLDVCELAQLQHELRKAAVVSPDFAAAYLRVADDVIPDELRLRDPEQRYRQGDCSGPQDLSLFGPNVLTGEGLDPWDPQLAPDQALAPEPEPEPDSSHGYDDAAARNAFNVAHDLAAFTTLPTTILDYHVARGKDIVASSVGDSSAYTPKNKRLQLSQEDIRSAEDLQRLGAEWDVDSTPEGTAAREAFMLAVLNAGLVRTLYHEATHSMVDDAVSTPTPSAAELTLRAIFSDVRAFYDRNREIRRKDPITGLPSGTPEQLSSPDRVAQEAIATYVGNRAERFVIAYLQMVKTIYDAEEFDPQDYSVMMPGLADLSTGWEDMGGYEPRGGVQWEGAKLPKDLGARIDAFFWPSLQADFFSNAAVRQVWEAGG